MASTFKMLIKKSINLFRLVNFTIMLTKSSFQLTRSLSNILHITGRTNFSDHFRKIIIRHKRIGYDLNVMRQSARFVINPSTVDSFGALLNCMPVNRASDSMMAPT